MARVHVLAPCGRRNEAAMMIFVFIFVALLCVGFDAASAGLSCTSGAGSCQSLVVFRPQSDRNVSTIEELFGTTNHSVAPGDRDKKWFVPVNCSCVNGTYVSLLSYTVKSGDTLSKIATYYQNLTTWPKIQEASMLESANDISPGEQLTVPIPCGCMANATNSTYVTYGRQAGDTADSIAEAMNANVSRVVKEAMEADKNNTVLVFPIPISATAPDESAPESGPPQASIPASKPSIPASIPASIPECTSDSCQSLIVFHPEPTQNITWIATLYGNEVGIVEQNRGSNTSAKWFIPVRCSCWNGMYRSLTSYTVMGGDSLSKIATYYQNLTTWEDLFAVNPRENANRIEVGEVLNVSIPCKCSAGKTYVTYGWQQGDTEELISAATNASIADVQAAMMRANDTGMVLVFPTSISVRNQRGDSMTWSPSALTILIQVLSVIAWLML